MGDKKKRRAGFGFAIWLFLAIIIFVVILINWGKISQNVKESGLLEAINTERTEDEKSNAEQRKAERQKRREKFKSESGITLNLFDKENNETKPQSDEQGTVINIDGKTSDTKTESKTESKADNSSTQKAQPAAEETKTEIKSEAETNKQTQAEIKTETQPESKTEQKTESKSEQKTENKSETKTESKVENKTEAKPETKTETAKVEPVKTETRNAKLYFINTSSGVQCKEVVRALPKSDSPMTDAINAVIAGPNSSERNAGCQSFVSSGTKLIGASVKNGIATLNFNENLAFNSFGAEGLQAALEQIVYTATAFSTVDSVQILVEGKMTDYLSEGVWIGTPLKRSSF